MTVNEFETQTFFRLQGRIESASYHESEIPGYTGNPLIEALPPLHSEDDLMDLMTKRPIYDETHRQLPDVQRLHLLENIKRFYQPMSRSLEMAQSFSIMLRSGYLDRNPMSLTYQSQGAARLERFIADAFDDDGVATSGLTCVGFSGMGKTRTFNRIASLYPQVIRHSSYQGRALTLQQLVWLKLDCPRNGTTKGLCISFFQMVDHLLGTQYFRYSAKNGDARVDTMVAQMAIVARNQCLGLLAIDEIQNLHGAKEGRELLNFLVQLSNEIRIPLFLIGTPTAEAVLTRAFRIARRGTGYGNFLWKQMQRSQIDEEEDWAVFMNALWEYLYVSKPSPLTNKLSDTLYSVSRGITDIAVKMFIAAQARAIRTGTETVTSGLIRSVAQEEFPWVNGALNALKLNTPEALKKYEDLYFRNVKIASANDFEQNTSSGSPLQLTSVPHKDETYRAQSRQEEANMPSDELTPRPSTLPRRIRKTAEDLKWTDGSLMQIVTDGHRQGLSAHDALKANGHICQVTEFLS